MRRKIALTVVLLLLVPFGSGCAHTYYHQRFPMLERPKRPVLVDIPGSEMKRMSEQARRNVIDNFNMLIDYCRKLEVAVDDYNKFAELQNDKMIGK